MFSRELNFNTFALLLEFQNKICLRVNHKSYLLKVKIIRAVYNRIIPFYEYILSLCHDILQDAFCPVLSR